MDTAPPPRTPYPSEADDEERASVPPYLTLIDEAVAQRRSPLRGLHIALHWMVLVGAPWRLLLNDLPP
jgi:hypothetical protein